MYRNLKKQSSVNQNEKSFADRQWKSTEPTHSEGRRHDYSNLRFRNPRTNDAARLAANQAELESVTITRPSDILTFAELEAFAADVADYVEESRFDLMADRMLHDIALLDHASDKLSQDLRMRANRESAGV